MLLKSCSKKQKENDLFLPSFILGLEQKYANNGNKSKHFYAILQRNQRCQTTLSSIETKQCMSKDYVSILPGCMYLAPSSSNPEGRKFIIINCPLKIVKYGRKANLSTESCSDFSA